MRRVMIIGPCGAGKSTLAFALAEKTGLPLFHMDKLAWKPGWVARPNDELREILKPIVARDRWLLEGNYGSTLVDRLPFADTVVYLDYPITLCMWRILMRIWRYRGISRPDMGEDCPERLDLGFLWYVARWKHGPRQRIEERIAHHAKKLVRLTSPRETKAWLEGVSIG